jgi:nucleotide-binding universal stress UspA family protein
MVRIENVLCPVDFFPASRRAFDYAVKLAASYGARIHLLHVIAPLIPATYGDSFDVGDLVAEIEKESAQMLAKLKARGEKAGATIHTEVAVGDIAQEIQRAADSRKADLVVMGAHGRRGLERFVMGSVTERMLRRCPAPLIVIGHDSRRRRTPPAIKRILATTDFSDGTTDAMAYAFSLAQECQARITLLHVVADLSAETGAKTSPAQMAAVREKLEALAPEGARDWCDVRIQVASGEPHEVIARMVKTQKPGLLVMNIHGKSMVERALLGRTAERVLRTVIHACPVLLIPPAQARGKRRGAAA